MTPFSKVKTWIKQGFYEKLPKSQSLKGALDFQQEVLHSLIRENILVTNDCCIHYQKIPIITNEEGDLSIPDGVLYLVTIDDQFVPVINVNGTVTFLTLSV